MVEYFILVYNSRLGKKYGRAKGYVDVSFLIISFPLMSVWIVDKM